MKLSQRLKLMLENKKVDRSGAALWKHLSLVDRDPVRFVEKAISFEEGNDWDLIKVSEGIYHGGYGNPTTEEIAKFLEGHPAVKRVYHPAQPSHPQYELAKAQMRAMGGIVLFELKGGMLAGKEFINNLSLELISISLGDPETLVQHPASMTHSSIPKKERLAYGISDGLIRISVGQEDSKDIIFDLEQSLNQIKISSMITATRFYLP